MAIRRNRTVVDLDGVRGRLREFDFEDDDRTTAVIELANGTRISVPADLLHPYDDLGGYRILARWAEVVATADQATLELPRHEDDTRPGVRRMPGERVRIRRQVVTEDRLVETPVWRERVEVERVPRDVFVEKMPETRRDGDTLVVPCVEEVIVKRLHVREEVRVRVIRERHVDRRTVPLRRHEIQIEREYAGSTTEKKDRGGTS